MHTHDPGTVYVVRGRSAGAVLARHGVRTEVVDDSLVYGPVSLNLAEHGRLRTKFRLGERGLGPGLQTHDRLEDSRAHVSIPGLCSALMEDDARALVVWLSPLWPDVLFFWWVSHGLLTSGFPQPRLFVAYPPEAKWPGAMNPADISAARVVGPLKATDIRAAARLWEHFASPSPAGLERARRARRTPLVSPGALRYYASLLPQRGKSAALLPSVADAWLLSHFADARPAHDAVANPWGGEADRWLLNMGEEFIFTRLWRWSVHQRGRWLKGWPEPGRDLRYVRYVMTDECREMLQKGTSRPRDLAPITVGGLHIPGARSVYVRAAHDGGWRIYCHRVAKHRRRLGAH